MHLGRYCNVLLVFGFNRPKWNINLTKSYLMPLPTNEGEVEQVLIQKANQFVRFDFRNVQLLGELGFLGGVWSFDFIPRGHKTSQKETLSI